MNKKAVVYIKSKQSVDDEGIEVVSAGSFEKTDYGFLVAYEETELSGMDGTTTYLKIFEEKLILQREGSTIAQLEFQKGNNNVSLYDTPYGTLELMLKTNDVSMNIDDNGGKIKVDYDISLSGQKPYKTILDVEIKA